MTKTRVVLNLITRARADFKEFWSGDPRLPYQGWFGRLAGHSPGIACILIASLSANAAWMLFSVTKRCESIPAKVVMTLFAWGCVVFATVFAAIFIIGVLLDSVHWLRVNLRSARTHSLGEDGRD